MRLRSLSVLAVAALALAGCGSSEEPTASATSAAATPADAAPAADPQTTSLDQITVKGDAGKKPEVSFKAPIAMKESESKVLIEGDGPKVGKDQQVSANMTLVDASGKVVESSYDTGSPAGFPMDTEQVNESLFNAIDGVKVGSRVLLALNGPPATGQPAQTLVYVIDVLDVTKVDKPLTRAEGEAVKPKEGLPKVTLDDSGKPSLEKPSGKAPKDLVVQPLIQGKGAEVKKGQTVSVHYSGWLWQDGQQFDSSWETGQPFSVTDVGNGPVIQGWNDALVGQKVGSQLLVVIPPDLGYGAQGSPPNIPADAPLVFVIDILSATG